MSGLDGISELVLENVKLASENVEGIAAFLSDIKSLYGTPLCLVHDMGVGILKAVAEVFPGVPDFVCHYHFLADIGEDLMGKDNETLRNRLRQHAVQGILRKKAKELRKILLAHPGLDRSLLERLTQGKVPEGELGEALPVAATYTLVLWTLEAKRQGAGYGFPFDRPLLCFYERIQSLSSVLKSLLAFRSPKSKSGRKSYVGVMRNLIETIEDKALSQAASRIRSKAAVFEELRNAMRIAPAQRQDRGEGSATEPMRGIREAVKAFRERLLTDPALSKQICYQKLVEQIDRYWEKLFCEPIAVQTPEGRRLIQPQRTNNLLELMFRELRHNFRKRTGMNHIGRALSNAVADTPLVRNLANPEYREVLLDGAATLEERFARIETRLVCHDLSALSGGERVPARIRKVLRMPDPVQAILAALTT